MAALPIYPIRLDPVSRARLERLAAMTRRPMAQVIKGLIAHPQALALLLTVEAMDQPTEEGRGGS